MSDNVIAFPITTTQVEPPCDVGPCIEIQSVLRTPLKQAFVLIWLEKALSAAGGEVFGGVTDGGKDHLFVTHDGQEYMVSIQPVRLK